MLKGSPTKSISAGISAPICPSWAAHHRIEKMMQQTFR